MRSNPLSRGAVFVTLGHSREPAVKPLLAVIASLAALALPAVASAGLATITFRAVLRCTARAERTLASTPGRFDLVGVRWHGSRQRALQRPLDGRPLGAVARRRRGGGRPAGRRARPRRRATRGWRVGNPTWVGPANGIRYRISGRVRDLRASFVRSPELKIPLRAVASAGSPPIVPRSAWGADESIRARRAAATRRRSGSRACTTRRARTTTRPRRRPRSCGGSRSTTSSRTAGTTSATTSSSTATAPSTRAATAASTGT